MGRHLMRGASECQKNGPVIPFGSMVEYHPISTKDLSRLHEFGKKVLPRIFLGYAFFAGGIWKGDITVADLEELEKMDASEIHAKRLNAKEMLTPMNGGKFIFPIADGTVKLSGGDQVLRTSTSVQDKSRPSRRTGQSSRRIRRVLTTTSRLHRRMMVEQEMISGPFQGNAFTVITLNRESNCACREKNHFLFHHDTLT